MKDLFSTQSQLYQQARPSYPQALVQELLKHVPACEFAWDCGAGSGQFTQLLAPYFEQIVATDLSANQLQHAPYFENVSYQVQTAEDTHFPPQCFDLISVSQAIHWFDFDAFYVQVKRTLKPDGLLAVLGYGLIHVEHTNLNKEIQHLYRVILKDYWDAERHYVDEQYQTIPFPFKEIAMPDFKIQLAWSSEQLIDYLYTWSAIKHYIQQNDTDPLNRIRALCSSDQSFQIEFPILLRVGTLG